MDIGRSGLNAINEEVVVGAHGNLHRSDKPETFYACLGLLRRQLRGERTQTHYEYQFLHRFL